MVLAAGLGTRMRRADGSVPLAGDQAKIADQGKLDTVNNYLYIASLKLPTS